MAILTWPADLPKAFPIEQADEPVSGKVGWDPDQGPARERTTQRVRHRRLSPPAFLMSESQVALFEDFYETLGNGVDPFDWLNPWTGAGVVRLRIVSYTIVWRTGPLEMDDDMLVAGTVSPQRQARVTIVFERRPWEPFVLAVPSATLSLANRITTSGIDLAAQGILAGDFVYFDADGQGKATAIASIVLPATLNLAVNYPVGPVGRTGAATLVKVARA